MTKNALGNLINRYKAVLKKCRILNIFGSLTLYTALAAATVMGASTAPKLFYPKEVRASTLSAADIIRNSVLSQKSVSTDPSNSDYFKEIKEVSATSSAYTFSVNTRDALGNAQTLYFAVIKDDGTVMNNSGNRQDSLSTSINQNFMGLHSTSFGGAISVAATADKIDIGGIFLGNSTSGVSGGAIFNANGGTVGTLSGTFIGNSTTGDYATGGAIDINMTGTIETLSGTFTGNSTNGYLATGGAITNYGHIEMLDGTFTDNSTGGEDAYGGAVCIATTGTIETLSGTFTGNSTKALNAVGGGITNYGNITTLSGTFTDNSTEGEYAYGGAIANYEHIEMLDGTFTDNDTEGEYAYGGAIANYDHIEMLNGTFISNSTKALNADGGAIANYGNITTLSGTFTDNSTEGEYAYGGAIANYDHIEMLDGTFISNSTSDKNAYGGAIYNYGNITTLSGTFIGNSTEGEAADGGAIANYGSITTLFGTFTGNNAMGSGSLGGFMFNDAGGSVGITADSGITLFDNNRDSTGANDIYNEGTLHINAGTLVLMTGGINGDAAAKGVIHINDGYANAMSNGMVIINSITNNDVSLQGGSLSLANGNTNSLGTGASLAQSGGTLYIDVDLIGGKADNVSSSTGGIVAFNIFNDAQNANIAVAGSSFAKAYTNDYSYTYDGTQFTQGAMGSGGLGNAINDTGATNTATFSLTEDMTLTANGGTLQSGKSLAIFGNGYTLDGGGQYQAISVDNGANLTVQDMSFTNHSTTADKAYGGAIANYGHIAMLDGTFTNNSTEGEEAHGGAIASATTGTIETLSGTFTGNSTKALNAIGGAIANYGNITTLSGTFTDNSTEGEYAYGGAIANYGHIAMLDGTFTDNSTKALNADGGAITNYGNITTLSGTFTDNSTEGEEAYGGAIANYGHIEMLDGTFTDNSTSDKNAYGSAIYNATTGTIEMLSGTFTGNSTKGINADGGAILNDGNITTLSGTFIGNSTEGEAAYGSTIANYGSIMTLFGTFTGNNAMGSGSLGGFIFNDVDCSVGIAADSGITLFDNNRDSTGANDIYNEGTLHINAGTLVLMTGGINGDAAAKGVIHINDGYANAMSNGMVIINSITNNDVSLHGGSLSLANGDTNSLGTGAILAQSGGTLYIDVDLSGGKADNVSSSTGGTVAFNILNDAPNANIAVEGSSFAHAYTNDYSYTYDGTQFTQGALGSGGLGNAINDTGATNIATFSLTKDMTLTANGGTLQSGKSLAIFGNGYTLDGGGQYQAISVDYGATLSVQDVNFTNHSSVYTGAIDNFGHITMLSGNFTNNSTSGDSAYGGAIFNSVDSTIEMLSGTFTNNSTKGDSAYGGAIINYGSMTRLDGTFTNNSTKGKYANGGAVVNSRNSTITTLSGTFTGNSTRGDNAHGGAIANFGSIATLSGTFTDNFTTGSGAASGAIVNYGSIATLSGTFTGNSTRGDDAHGGAIANFDSIATLSGTFTGNSTTGSDAAGGAIANFGSIATLSGTFTDNFTTGSGSIGGAILNYVGGSLGITADSGITLFDDNRDSTGANDIYNAGELHINAGALVLMTGGISGNATDKGTIDINDGYANAKSNGVVIINSIANNDVRLYDGSLFVADGNINDTLGLSQSGGTLYIDVDLSGGKADNVSSSTGGIVAFNIFNDAQNANIAVAGSSFAKAYTNDYSYTYNGTQFTQGAMGSGGLGNALNDTGATNTATFSLTENMTLAANGGTLQSGKSLAIFGNGYTLDGGGQYQAISVDNGANLTVQDMSFTNHSTTADKASGAVISNLGHIAMLSGTFTDNSTSGERAPGGAISNLGHIAMLDGTFTDNSTSGEYAHGAAISIGTAATIEMLSGTFTGNSTNGYFATGGAIANYGHIAMLDGTFTDNSTSGTYSYGGAISIGTAGTIDMLSGTFTGNSTKIIYSDGGAINNYGDITTLDGTFTDNSTKGEAAFGGAIANYGNITTLSGTFIGNSTSAKNAHGGAIFNSWTSTIEMLSGTFTGNSTTAIASDGGAIFNKGYITTLSGTFTGNSTKGEDAFGGAIVNYGNITTLSGTFTGNSTKGEDAYGAVIANYADITTLSGTFAGNSSSGRYSVGGVTVNYKSITTFSGIFTDNGTTGFAAAGGVLLNGVPGTIKALSGTFTDNYTAGDYAHGGVIGNFGSIMSVSGTFTGNNTMGSGSLGGALFNFIDGTVGITADSGITLFDDNHDSGGANDIFNEDTLHINSGELVLMTGGISGDATDKGTIHINDGYANAKSNGVVIINNIANNTVNLHGGSLFIADGNINDTVSLNQSGGTLYIDVDLTGAKADNVSSSTGGIVAFNIVNDAPSANIAVAGSSFAHAYTNDYSYTYDGTQFTQGAANSGGLSNAINDTGATNIATFSLTKDMTLAASGGTLQSGKSLAIFGNGYTLDGGGQYQGISVAEGAKLSVQNISFTHNSTTAAQAFGGAIYNLGSMAMLDGTFTNNNTQGDYAFGGAILNGLRSTIEMLSGTFTGNSTMGEFAIGGAIANLGSITRLDGTFTNNHTWDANASGGAITNFGDITRLSGTFANNSTTGTSAGGGGITNGLSGTITTLSGTFTDNSTSGAGAHGAAIANFGSIATLSGTFTNNNTTGANSHGGVIANFGNITTLSGTFTGNSTRDSGTVGGALFNFSDGIVGITADSGITLFDDNHDSTGANDIYNLEELHINAGALVLITGGISGNATDKGTIDINDGYANAKSNGMVIINSIANNDVSLHGGSLSLANGDTNSLGTGASLEHIGGTLYIDVDLIGAKTDNVSSSAGGIIAFNILNDAPNVSIAVPGNSFAHAYTNDYSYTYDGTQFTQGAANSGGLSNALADTGDIRTFSMTTNHVTSGGTLAQGVLTMFGQSSATLSAANSGDAITVQSNTSLNLMNMNMSGLEINNAGTITVNGNVANATPATFRLDTNIVNNGSIVVNTATDFGSISGDGDLSVNADTKLNKTSTLAGAVTNAAKLTLAADTTLSGTYAGNGALAVASGGGLHININMDVSNSEFTVDANAGAFTLGTNNVLLAKASDFVTYDEVAENFSAVLTGNVREQLSSSGQLRLSGLEGKNMLYAEYAKLLTGQTQAIIDGGTVFLVGANIDAANETLNTLKSGTVLDGSVNVGTGVVTTGTQLELGGITGATDVTLQNDASLVLNGRGVGDAVLVENNIINNGGDLQLRNGKLGTNGTGSVTTTGGSHAFMVNVIAGAVKTSGGGNTELVDSSVASVDSTDGDVTLTNTMVGSGGVTVKAQTKDTNLIITYLETSIDGATTLEGSSDNAQAHLHVADGRTFTTLGFQGNEYTRILMGDDQSKGTFISKDGVTTFGGAVFSLDPAWVNGVDITGASVGVIHKFGAAGIDGTLRIGRNSYVVLGDEDTAWAQQEFAKTNLTWAEDAVSAALFMKTPQKLATNGAVVVDGTLTHATVGTNVAPHNSASFTAGSLFVVNVDGLDSHTAMLSAANGKLTVDKEAKLHISGGEDGQSIMIVNGFTDDSTVAEGGWEENNLTTSSSLITATATQGFVAGSGTFTVNLGRVGAEAIMADYPLMQWKTANLLVGSGTDTESMHTAEKFFARTMDNKYLGRNKAREATYTAEGALQVGTIGAVNASALGVGSSIARSIVVRNSPSGQGAAPQSTGKAPTIAMLDGKNDSVTNGMAAGSNNIKNGAAVWFMPLYKHTTVSGVESGAFESGYSSDIGGLSVGADYTFQDMFRFGLMLSVGAGHAYSSGDFNDTTNSFDFWGLSAYGGIYKDNFAVTADVGFSSVSSELTQDMPSAMGMSDLEGSVMSSMWTLGLTAEYTFKTKSVDITPHVGIRYMHVFTEGYEMESGGGTVSEMDSDSQGVWYFPVGVTLSKDIMTDSGWVIKPKLDLGFIAAAGDLNANSKASIPGVAGSANYEMQNVDGFAFNGGVGIEIGYENLTFGLNYNLQASEHETGHMVFGTFRLEF